MNTLRRSVTMSKSTRSINAKMVPLARVKSELEIAGGGPGGADKENQDVSLASGKSMSRMSLAQSISDLKQTAEHLKDAFIKLVNYDKVIKIAPPGSPGTEKNGPWSDSFITSPIPQWKLNPETMADKTSLHVMTVGRPFIDPETGDELRRVKVYEHHIVIPNVDEIAKKLVSDPADALMIVDSILRSPYTKCKLTDKMLTKQSAIAALSMAQINLLPLFGVWLNGLLCPELDVKASTTTVYLCGHCTENGTVARVLKQMEPDCDRERVLNHLTTMLSKILTTYWETHKDSGWSMCVCVPPGVRGDQAFY
ncbi:hypothetical protein BDR26DRAFT_858752 [Obelidium mucronatum]|nr:hypothetical protein BDR26DRAFT_858752 [Obelidium mucronatum]